MKKKNFKIAVSICFGILGFIANFYSIEIINLSKVEFKVNLLWGLLFPLLISLAWGFKYGLISGLAGGCQTMWWLWTTDGYGLFYAVPIFFLWILWHGWWSDQRKNNPKWYLNEFILEIPFRLISIAGFYTIFRYLVSLNPPFWNPEINKNFVSSLWLNNVMLKHIFTAYTLLIVANTLLNISAIRKFFKLKEQRHYQRKSLIIYSFIFIGLSLWIVDTVFDYVFFYNKTFFELLLFDIPSHEIFIRTLIFLICLISGLIISSIFSRFASTEKKYKNLFNNLEDAIFLFKSGNNTENTFMEINKEAKNLVDYTRKELLSLSLCDISELDYIPSDNNNNSSKFETNLITKTNNKIPVEIKCKNYKMKGEKVTLAIARDITERKEKENKLHTQKEELQASNEQLSAFSEEIVAMNNNLNQSFKEINDLNERFQKMVEVLTNLSPSAYKNENKFLSKLLHSAIEIVSEADYGKIIKIKDNQYFFVDTIGHNIDLLNNVPIPKKSLFKFNNEIIHKSSKYSINIQNLPETKRTILKKAFKPIKESIYFDITLESKIVGRIVLDIAENNKNSFDENSVNLIQSFSNLASAFFSFQRYNKLQGQFTEELIGSITSIMDMYDKYTSGHSENVAELSAEIAEKMNLSEKDINDAYWSGLVHDIGKLLIPLEILNKKGSLSDEEYELIKKHPEWSYKALKNSSALKDISRYVLYHHERWDGRGYPEGLKEDEIPLISQILILADAWDAMRSKRAYRSPLSKDAALQEVKNNKGTQFAPKIVETFLQSEILL